MQERFLRLTGGLMGYYLVSLVFNPLIKTALEGFPGTAITCFLQMFYVVFAFPLLMETYGRKSTEENL